MTSPRMSPSVGDWAEGRCTPRAYVRCFDFRHYWPGRADLLSLNCKPLLLLSSRAKLGSSPAKGPAEPRDLAFCVCLSLYASPAETQGASTTPTDSQANQPAALSMTLAIGNSAEIFNLHSSIVNQRGLALARPREP